MGPSGTKGRDVVGSRNVVGGTVVMGTVVMTTVVGGESVCCVFAAQVEYPCPVFGGL